MQANSLTPISLLNKGFEMIFLLHKGFEIISLLNKGFECIPRVAYVCMQCPICADVSRRDLAANIHDMEGKNVLNRWLTVTCCRAVSRPTERVIRRRQHAVCLVRYADGSQRASFDSIVHARHVCGVRLCRPLDPAALFTGWRWHYWHRARLDYVVPHRLHTTGRLQLSLGPSRRQSCVECPKVR